MNGVAHHAAHASALFRRDHRDQVLGDPVAIRAAPLCAHAEIQQGDDLVGVIEEGRREGGSQLGEGDPLERGEQLLLQLGESQIDLGELGAQLGITRSRLSASRLAPAQRAEPLANLAPALWCR